MDPFRLSPNLANSLAGYVDAATRPRRLFIGPSVNIVHNETSTGVTSNIAEIRKAMDQANHPALLMVDTISSLGSVDYRHEEWNVDVSVGCSQKGLMLPPGLGFNAVSEKAIKASKSNSFIRHFWDWNQMLKANENSFYPSTPGTNLLFGLLESIKME